MNCVIIGDVCFDLMLKTNSLLDPSSILVKGGTSYLTSMMLAPGGLGNVAVGLSRLGGEVDFIGRAGKDDLGHLYEINLQLEGVKTHISMDERNSTGIIAVFVDSSGERSFLVSRGANEFLSSEHISFFSEIIASSSYLFLSGYSTVDPLQRSALLKAIDLAVESNVKVVLDLGSHNLVRDYLSFFNTLISKCDVVIPNFLEAAALTGHTDLPSLIQFFSKKAPLTALKLGEAGCVLITPDETINCAALNVPCIDSTGAGDAFASGLLYGLMNNFSLAAAGKLANWYASFNIQHLGSRVYPDKIQIKEYLSSFSL